MQETAISIKNLSDSKAQIRKREEKEIFKKIGRHDTSQHRVNEEKPQPHPKNPANRRIST